MKEVPRDEELFGRYLISLNKANKLEELMKEIQGMKYNRDINNVPIRSFKDSLIPEPLFFPPTLSGGKHNKLPNVSKKLDLKNIDNNHEVLVAKKKVNAGDVLLVEKSAILATHPSEEYSVPGIYRCHYCLKIMEYFVTCTGCDVVIFCGYKCRYYSWNEYHRWECYGMQRGFFLSNTPSYISMRMLFFSLQFEDNAISKAHYANQYNYQHFVNLPYDIQENNNMELFSILKECVYVILYLSEHTQFFEWIVQFPKYKEKSQFELYATIGGLLLRYYSQFNQNSVKLKQTCFHGFPNNKQMEYYADGLFLSTQWFSKSPHPNSVWLHYENYLIIKACQDILPGDKITVRWREDSNDCRCEDCVAMGKRNSFLCKKCKSAIWPVDKAKQDLYFNIKYMKSIEDFNEDVEFFCENCKKPGDLSEYKSSLTYAQNLIDIYYKRQTSDYLKNVMDEYRKILNRDHIYFVAVNVLYMQYFMNTKKDSSKAIEKASEALRIISLHYGKMSKVFVNAQIFVLYQLTEHHKRKGTLNRVKIKQNVQTEM